jgi:hypothetical protein
VNSKLEVEVRCCASRVEAELAVADLAVSDIPARIVSDDAGGAFPSLQEPRGVRVLVPREHEENAKALLSRPPAVLEPSELLRKPMDPRLQSIFGAVAIASLVTLFALFLWKILNS